MNVLQHHLQSNGAQTVSSMDEFAHPDIPKDGQGLYIIVPYTMAKSEVPSTSEFDCEVVTDMWLERCLDAKALVLPRSHVANTPFLVAPLPGLFLVHWYISRALIRLTSERV